MELNSDTGGQMYRLVDGKRLRCGYTTGTCATAAAKAAAALLLLGKGEQGPDMPAALPVEVATPSGRTFSLVPEDLQTGDGWASCAVRKDAGDDPDVTNGVLVYAKVEKRAGEGVTIDGGVGVGRVTKPGLDRKPGEAAINTTPRKMISAVCREVCEEAGYGGGLMVTISIPAGVELARKTFNPKVGVVGGISVLGTSGLVEPMSEKAYVDSMRIEIRQLYEEGARDLLVLVGNFARDFAFGTLGLEAVPSVKCSNFIGAAFEIASELRFARVLLVGHLGKIVKLGIGITNTHSSNGDGRIETLIACALEAGAGIETLRGIAACVSTDAIVDILEETGFLVPSMGILEKRIAETLRRHSSDGTETGFIVFCKEPGAAPADAEKENEAPREGKIVAQSGNAWALVEALAQGGAYG